MVYMNVTKKDLKVLKIIHGYPPYYLAGSEVYTYNFSEELSKYLEVTIFTRIEDVFKEPYSVEESVENGVKIVRVNKPSRDYTFRSKYYDRRMAEIFEDYLLKVEPDIVHIGHLSHLTVLIIDIIKKYEIPIIFTLHDYWMMCIRGQLIRDNFSLCSGPSLENCTECNSRYFVSKEQKQKEVKKWLNNMRELNEQIDLFLAPSQFLRKKYIEYGIPEHKIVNLDYGFNTRLFDSIKKAPSDKIRFGFLGRIIPVKGIATLIDSFNEVDHSKAELNIYGRIPSSYQYLKARCTNSAVNFKGEFNYKDIAKVFSDIDVLVFPSIWYENSPLVIHEAFLANVPVITSNLAGMAELVQDGKNGLLCAVGDAKDLRNKINRLIDEPDLISKLTENKTPVRSIQQDVQDLTDVYYKLLYKEGI